MLPIIPSSWELSSKWWPTHQERNRYGWLQYEVPSSSFPFYRMLNPESSAKTSCMKVPLYSSQSIGNVIWWETECLTHMQSSLVLEWNWTNHWWALVVVQWLPASCMTFAAHILGKYMCMMCYPAVLNHSTGLPNKFFILFPYPPLSQGSWSEWVEVFPCCLEWTERRKGEQKLDHLKLANIIKRYCKHALS